MKTNKISVIPFFKLNTLIYAISYIIFKNFFVSKCIHDYSDKCRYFSSPTSDYNFYGYIIPLILGILVVVLFDIIMKKIIKSEKSYKILSKITKIVFIIGIIVPILFLISSQVGSSFCIGNDCGQPFSILEAIMITPILILVLIYEYFFAIASVVIFSLAFAKIIFGKLNF